MVFETSIVIDTQDLEILYKNKDGISSDIYITIDIIKKKENRIYIKVLIDANTVCMDPFLLIESAYYELTKNVKVLK